MVDQKRRARKKEKPLKTLDMYYKILNGNSGKKPRKSKYETRPAPEVMQMHMPDIPFIPRTKVPPLMELKNATGTAVVAVVCPLQCIQQYAPNYYLNLVEYRCTHKVAFIDRMVQNDKQNMQAGNNFVWVAIAAVSEKHKLSLFETTSYLMMILGSGEIGSAMLSNITLHENNQCGWACIRYQNN